MAHGIFSTDHLGDPNDSKSIGNQLLAYTRIIPEIDLPDRVQLAAELEYFFESLPLKSGRNQDVAPDRAGGGQTREIY